MSDDADDRPEGARVEGVALHDDDGAAEAGLGPRGLAEVRPPDLALGDHHSADSSVRRAARLVNSSALGLAEAREDGVEPGGHLVGRVARDVLAERGAVHLAPGPAGALGEAVHLGEQVVGHGDGGLHTASITTAPGGNKKAGPRWPGLVVSGEFGRGERRQTSTTDLNVPVRLPLEIALTGVERWTDGAIA